MRHQKAFRKLGRNPAHRRALLRNLATSLVLHKRIETTLPKAKELKRVADKLVTLGKKDSLHARRQALGYFFQSTDKTGGTKSKSAAVHTLFTEIAPSFSERNGGYTRVLRTRVREGDKAQMAIIEFVESAVTKKAKSDKPKRKVRKTAASKEAKTTKKAPDKKESKPAEKKTEEAKKD